MRFRERAIGGYPCVRTVCGRCPHTLPAAAAVVSDKPPLRRVNPASGLAEGSRHSAQAVGMGRKTAVLLLVAVNGPGSRRRNIHNREPALWCPGAPHSEWRLLFMRVTGAWSLFSQEDGSVLPCVFAYRTHVVETG